MGVGPGIDVVAISQDAPCGPDLVGDGDAAFMNFSVRAEGLFPASFYSKIDGTPFDRGSFDFAAECKIGEGLAARTHDIRLLAILAKLHALNRDAAKVVQLVERIAAIIENYWDDVHPHAEAGDFTYRMACLQALDDTALIILPLQYSALLKESRVGAISLRTILLSTAQLEPREGERRVEPAVLDRAMDEVDLQALCDARDLFDRLVNAVGRIRDVWLERAGYDQAVRFDLVAPFAVKARDVIAAFAAKREALAAETSGGLNAAANGSAGADGLVGPGAVDMPGSMTHPPVATFADAQNALSAAADYFARNEPSSPALLLIRQAQQLVGKSFLDVLRILAPDQMDAACLNIGKDASVHFPVERLAEFSAIGHDAPTGEEPQKFVATSRPMAVKMLALVNAFYAVNEPSSPLPLFTERARALAGRDFLGILRDVLPEDALKVVARTTS